MAIASRRPGEAPRATGPVRLHALDGLRGLLALYVALYHLAAPLAGSEGALRPLAAWLEPAWYSVDVFFLMSGFVMAHVYGREFAAGATAAGSWRFLRARVARLYPVHLAVLAILFVTLVPRIHGDASFLSADGRYSWQALLASLAMLHGPWLEHRTWNYPAWSISAEWHAYLLFPLVAPWLLGLRRAPRLIAIAVAVAIPALLYAWRLDELERFPTNGLPVLARVLPLFAAGVLLHRFQGWPGAARHDVLLAVLAVTLTAFAVPSLAPLAVLGIPLLVLCALRHPLLNAALSRPSMVLLGTWSYSLYMSHALVELYWVGGLVRGLSKFGGVDVAERPLLSALVLASAVAVALALAWALWRWVEVPGRAAVARWGRPTPAQAALDGGAR